MRPSFGFVGGSSKGILHIIQLYGKGYLNKRVSMGLAVNRQMAKKITVNRQKRNIREVKHDVYGKRQTAKMKLSPSVSSSLYSRIKIFVFAVNSKRHFSIFV